MIVSAALALWLWISMFGSRRFCHHVPKIAFVLCLRKSKFDFALALQ